MTTENLSRGNSVADPRDMSPKSGKNDHPIQAKTLESNESEKLPESQQEKLKSVPEIINNNSKTPSLSVNSSEGLNIAPAQSSGVEKNVLEEEQDGTVKKPSKDGIVDVNGNLEHIHYGDIEDYEADWMITEKEKKDFDHMISKMKEDLVQRQVSFEKWSDSITRRRMFALSRLRKLGIHQKERSKFYKQMENFVQDAEDILQSAAEMVHNKKLKDSFEPSSSQTVSHNLPKTTSSNETDMTSQDDNTHAKNTGFVDKSSDISAELVKTKEDGALTKTPVVTELIKS